mmetsp:Transcript_1527/g.4140  ORF Transcript_1527/g.4140 Transcript_1527/m.4140 type:complete len:255 (-) Transcript_1527:259-1023(-)
MPTPVQGLLLRRAGHGGARDLPGPPDGHAGGQERLLARRVPVPRGAKRGPELRGVRHRGVGRQLRLQHWGDDRTRLPRRLHHCARTSRLAHVPKPQLVGVPGGARLVWHAASARRGAGGSAAGSGQVVGVRQRRTSGGRANGFGRPRAGALCRGDRCQGLATTAHSRRPTAGLALETIGARRNLALVVTAFAVVDGRAVSCGPPRSTRRHQLPSRSPCDEALASKPALAPPPSAASVAAAGDIASDGDALREAL